MKFFWRNLVDAADAVLTASSANASYPVSNLVNAHLQKLWRTGTSATEEYITIDFGEAKTLGAIILAAHDFTTDDDLRFMVSDSDAFTDADEFPIDWSAGTILAEFPEVSARYFRVMFTKANAGDTRQLGRLFVGPVSDFDDLPDDKGFRSEIKDLSKVATSLGGQDWGEARPRYREFKITGSKLEQESADELAEMDDFCGIVTPFFFRVQDPVGGLNELPLDEVIYARFKSATGQEYESADRTIRWKVTLDLKEYI